MSNPEKHPLPDHGCQSSRGYTALWKVTLPSYNPDFGDNEKHHAHFCWSLQDLSENWIQLCASNHVTPPQESVLVCDFLQYHQLLVQGHWWAISKWCITAELVLAFLFSRLSLQLWGCGHGDVYSYLAWGLLQPSP